MAKWWRYKKRCLKLIRLFFSQHTKNFRWQSFIKTERLSQELFMSESQYQNSTKCQCHQWLALSLLKPKSFLDIIPKAFQTKFPQIRIVKSKIINVPISVRKSKKTKKCENVFWVTKRGNVEISNRSRF